MELKRVGSNLSSLFVRSFSNRAAAAAACRHHCRTLRTSKTTVEKFTNLHAARWYVPLLDYKFIFNLVRALTHELYAWEGGFKTRNPSFHPFLKTLKLWNFKIIEIIRFDTCQISKKYYISTHANFGIFDMCQKFTFWHVSNVLILINVKTAHLTCIKIENLAYIKTENFDMSKLQIVSKLHVLTCVKI